MNKKQLQRSMLPRVLSLFLPVILLLALLTGESLFALGRPDMTMEHLSGPLFVPQQPLTLDVRIGDAAGIIAARCYFRYQSAADYVYVDLDFGGDKAYQATLPAPGAAVQDVEYFFLAVNGAHQVVRSPAYTLHRDALAHSVASGPAPGGGEIRTDGVAPETFSPSLSSSDAVQVVPTAQSERYGLVAGVYQAAQAGPGLVAGYFGGFQLDAKGRPVPVKGLVDFASPGPGGPKTSAAGTGIVGPAIAGKWWGSVYTADEVTGAHSIARPLTAEITQVGNHVTIVTSLTQPRPQRLDGTMNADGNMLLYDEINEDWSTHWGPATTTQMTLADYIYPPTDAEHHPPLLVVKLQRASLKHALPPPKTLPSAVYDLLLRKTLK